MINAWLVLFCLCLGKGVNLPGEQLLPDTQCSLESVQSANSQQLSSVLQRLIKCDSFSIFKANLQKPCEYFGKKAAEECAPVADLPESMCSLQPASKSFSPFGGPPTDFVAATLPPKEQKPQEEPCSDDENSPTFWLNICGDEDQGLEPYNLTKYPERNTYYKGSEIWKAIYAENCFVRAGSQEDLCYEERVLYRLLSGMHTSISIHIALEFFTRIQGGKTVYEPNPQRFIDLYAEHPERLHNLHFGFVVLLRALHKAAPHLKARVEREGCPQTRELLNQLLDTQFMKNCGNVFSAFDESLLFKEELHDRKLEAKQTWTRGLTMDGKSMISLKQQFKGVFRNISRLTDCVSCEKCRLHAKLQLLGIGSALKIVLCREEAALEETVKTLTDQEFVALINTLARWSHAIKAVQDFETKRQEVSNVMEPLTKSPQAPDSIEDLVPPITNEKPAPTFDLMDILDHGLGMISNFESNSDISSQDEATLIDSLLASNPQLLMLVKHYKNNPQKFLQHVLRNIHIFPNANGLTATPKDPAIDAIVIGGGLAGLTATLQLLDRGANVVLLEKERFFGGNSAWASSGINSIDPVAPTPGDSIDVYLQDMIKASGKNSSLAQILTEQSGEALTWLRSRVGVGLPEVGQLGGHSFARTYRPSEGLAGATMMVALGKLIEKGNWGSRLRIIKEAKLNQILEVDGVVTGVQYQKDNQNHTLYSSHVVLATGGYANDFTEDSLLKKYTPELTQYATSNGRWATGDGIKLAMAIGADTVDIKNVQVHPTGFIDPKFPDATMKTLCAEILRGVGGILVDSKGHRFVNELGTRDYVTQTMKEHGKDNLKFSLILNEEAANKASIHVPMYTRKGLLTKYESIEDLARGLKLDSRTLKKTFLDYNRVANEGKDQFGKTHFHSLPFQEGAYYVGTVTPILHYCMGGLKIDGNGNVISTKGEKIEGLHAIGEITGGLHGKTRLGGNALTECVVFGSVVGKSLPIASKQQPQQQIGNNPTTKPTNTQQPQTRKITKEELARHNSEKDLWIALQGKVYDFTPFLADHPGGPESLIKIAGIDGTEAFAEVHSTEFLEGFEPLGDFSG